MAVGAPSARLLCNRPFYYKLTQFNHLISSERRRGTPPCKAQELASEPYPPSCTTQFPVPGLAGGEDVVSSLCGEPSRIG